MGDRQGTASAVDGEKTLPHIVRSLLMGVFLFE